MSKICLVGAGNIARAHAEALRLMPGHTVTAVVDPNVDAATRMAAGLGAKPFATLEAALADTELFSRGHVLTPPDLHHDGALALLRAGKSVLVEKPLAVDSAQCAALTEAAAAAGVTLGVNQNFVHHPAMARLRALLARGALGRARWVGCTYNVPLRQLGAKQFGHWMFQAPGNILLEQAVHPLSQIVALAGPIGTMQALAGPAIDIAPGTPFISTLDVVMHGALLPAQLRFAVGQEFPFWQVTAVCDDGVAVADILADRLLTYGRGRWMPAVDDALAGVRSAGGMMRDSVGGLVRYAAATAKLRPRSDPFFLSMRGSIGAFHTALDAGQAPELDGAFGAHLVSLCERIRDMTLPARAPAPVPATEAATGAATGAEWDVAVLGGTGFIGTHVVQRFLDAGLRVGVMARTGRNLPAVFHDPRVTFVRGSIGDQAAVERAIGGAKYVVNLAHGGGGASFEAVRDAMVGGAETVARACLKLGVTRLVYVGSIASLYLGPQPAPIDGTTPPDPQETQRGDYARAKVLADRMLMQMHRDEKLPVVILRPGVVVGSGGLPFHSGVGLYNTDQHAIGWNAGTNPLPFVLAEDVADAVYRATQAAGVDGHAYNLVGDVRMTARDYTAALAQAMHRPLQFHPQSARFLWAEDMGKWLVKRATGRAVPAPALRDFLSRGMMATFDTSDVKRDLGWTPVADPAEFLERAVHIYA